MKEIKLIHIDYRKPILFALVDDEDYERLIKYKWSYYKSTRGTIYAHTHIENKITKMHQLILQSTDVRLTVDHINGNGLDNQRKNLRFADKYQQAWNSRKRKDKLLSKYRGVYYNALNKNWRARITCKHRTYELGSFLTEKEAALAYNRAAIKYFGEFAKLNIVE